MSRRRISPDNPVRRRLFADEPDEARLDNTANFLQESIANERAQKKLKWNFDFKNEVPLEGVYEWYACDGRNDWIGIKSDDDAKEEDSLLQMKMENEVTPKSNKDGECAPLLRKRRTDVESVNDKGVKRRISFEKC